MVTPEPITLTTTVYHDVKPSDGSILAVPREDAKLIVTEHRKRSRVGIAIFAANYGDGDVLVQALAVEARNPVDGSHYWLANGKGLTIPMAYADAMLEQVADAATLAE